MGHPVNAQYQNYVERSINVVKRWVREIGGITNRQPFPVLGFTEWEYIFEKVSNDLNIIPIAKGQENSYLSPGSLIYPQSKESLAIPDVKSNMVDINRMIKRMRA